MASKSPLKYRLVQENFKCYEGLRIQQGEYGSGPEKLSTLLRSCVCIGFYHPAARIGAISHITGFKESGGHSAEGALRGLERQLRRRGIAFTDCYCFVIGGADSSKHVYHSALEALKHRGIEGDELDSLGSYHRKLMLDPATGELLLYKKYGGKTKEAVDATFEADAEGRCFDDPGKRLITGASLLFRNRHLLRQLTETILPAVEPSFERIHIWCAGCSVGMEAYSIAMVALDWLREQGSAKSLRVLGSDISEDALYKAALGEYPVGVQQFQGHKALLERYTQDLENRCITMGKELRQVVHFVERDIRVGSRKHRFELVVCDHVLQYFSESDQRIFVDSLCRAVQPEGFLFVSTPSSSVLSYVEKRHRFSYCKRHLYRAPLS